jgi:hypothetical protein
LLKALKSWPWPALKNGGLCAVAFSDLADSKTGEVGPGWCLTLGAALINLLSKRSKVFGLACFLKKISATSNCFGAERLRTY